MTRGRLLAAVAAAGAVALTGAATAPAARATVLTQVVEFDGGGWFVAHHGGRATFVRTGGTPATTRIRTSVKRRACRASCAHTLAATAGRLVLVEEDRSVRSGLSRWRAWSTAATGAARPLLPGFLAAHPTAQPVPGRQGVLLVERLRAGGAKLWRATGTEPGEAVLLGTLPGASEVIEGPDGTWYLSDGPGRRPRSGADPYAPGTLWAIPPGAGLTRLALAGGDFARTTRFGDGRLWFPGRDELTGREPWVTDGTPEGTRPLANLRYAAGDSFWWPGPVVGGRWIVGDRGAKALAPGAAPALLTGPLNEFRNPTALGGRVLGWSREGTLHVVEPAGGETVFTPRPEPSAPAVEPAVAGGLVFWPDTDHLWRSDGTAAGTRRLHLFRGGYSYKADVIPAISWLRTAAGRAYFLADSVRSTDSLWTSDGTLAGTVLLWPRPPGA